MANSSRQLQESEFHPWSYGEPNGEERENCGLTIVTKSPSNLDVIKWYDGKCSWHMPALCEIPTKEVFIIRGKLRFCFS